MKPLNLTVEEARDLLIKKLNVKPTKIASNYFWVRRLSTLKRAEHIGKKKLWYSLYSNSDATVGTCEKHYYIDFWVNDTLLTIRCKRNDKE